MASAHPTEIAKQAVNRRPKLIKPPTLLVHVLAASVLARAYSTSCVGWLARLTSASNTSKNILKLRYQKVVRAVEIVLVASLSIRIKMRRVGVGRRPEKGDELRTVNLLVVFTFVSLLIHQAHQAWPYQPPMEKRPTMMHTSPMAALLCMRRRPSLTSLREKHCSTKAPRAIQKLGLDSFRMSGSSWCTLGSTLHGQTTRRDHSLLLGCYKPDTSGRLHPGIPTTSDYTMISASKRSKERLITHANLCDCYTHSPQTFWPSLTSF
ncbi:uncharacterized protein MYCFIDRAFT_178292 [Pseudocercospora fijiensis CIRAD86]|uniref:Uncharacterized protein n=1 Tax=Pseudocercospora fijiensis (strain CIRAD86) TaxID=383855 RepID=M3ARP1_PSEFD|nr:uncharacterized protein MYCFIDRAFT_178292 [Pseudocercospora fijiensis CIRAD86]EME79728.1 hypothetical protein MYCFIDRAFT_178292 [Pseudocercospora fijiensis CIRAD86]